jgi:hypothetical protein
MNMSEKINIPKEEQAKDINKHDENRNSKWLTEHY